MEGVARLIPLLFLAACRPVASVPVRVRVPNSVECGSIRASGGVSPCTLTEVCGETVYSAECKDFVCTCSGGYRVYEPTDSQGYPFRDRTMRECGYPINPNLYGDM